ncbi:MAG: amidohydrolase [Christensenellaceae bacterium]|jgi:predicted amidohydrolase YtcJ|nr:amidohydrolase [Christensenellaceae bacterium]
MDKILFNARVHTMDEARPTADAIAISGGKIAAVGSDEEILRLQTAKTELIDLKNAAVLPGLSDTHLHLRGLGESFLTVNLNGTRSIGEALGAIGAFLAAHPGDGPVRGRGWNQDLWAEGRLPTRHDLDRIQTGRPIVLSRVCGHMSVCNSRALEFFGILGHGGLPGGEILLGEDGLPNGLLTETAQSLANPSVELELGGVKQRLAAAMAHAASKGLTAAHSDDFPPSLGGAETIMRAYEELQAEGKMPLRVFEQAHFRTPEALGAFFAKGYGYDHAKGSLYKVKSLKMLADGSLGARTAALRGEYADAPGQRGTAVYPQKELDAMVALAHAHGLPVSIHAIGDRAMDMVLDAVERAQKAFPGLSPRHGIIHCQISDEPLLDRFAALRVQALVQPVFLEYDAHIVDARVGKTLAATSYNWDGFLKRGVNVSAGSDCPVEPLDPLLNLYCAIERKDFEQRPKNGCYSEHCLSPWDAVSLFTVNAARAVGEEGIRGRIKPGMLADLSVFDVDPFSDEPERLLSGRALMTLLGGKLAFCAEGF